MSAPEYPADTEAQQILQGIADIKELLGQVASGLNHVGAVSDWMQENVAGIFQMFGSPQFMSMFAQMPAMMAGMESPDAGKQDGPAEAGPAEAGAD